MDKLLEVSELTKYFPVRKGFFRRVAGHVKAVDNVSFAIGKGEIVGLVGESGCGKSTLGRLILRLIHPTSGRIMYDGKNVMELKNSDLKWFRKRAQIIFQDPYSSLNPRLVVSDMFAEGLRAHGIVSAGEVADRSVAVLRSVGLPEDARFKYPHEFSGGQRQRLAIARALILEPEFIVCDEPVSALDVSIQSQILNLLVELKEKYSLTYLFISHDLAVVKYLSDRILVMYLGEVVEEGLCDEVMSDPRHPYTRALLGAVPRVGRKLEDKVLLEGDPPSPVNVPSGCRFHTRCPIVMDLCSKRQPGWSRISAAHNARCFALDSDACKASAGAGG